MNKYLRFLINSEYRFKTLDDRGFFNKMSDERYLKRQYRAIFHKRLDLKNPQTFNEKLQWLKLYDRKPFYTTLVDKYAVRQYISDTIGGEFLIPLVGGPWRNFEEIDFDTLPNQFVLKCTHDSGGIVICRDKDKFNIEEARMKITRSLKRNYYLKGREWPYKNVPPRIIAEEYMKEGEDAFFLIKRFSKCGKYDDDNRQLRNLLPAFVLQKQQGLLDYKFMCFDGQVKALFLDVGVIGKGTGHAEEYFRNIYDQAFNLLPIKETRENYPVPIEPPVNYNAMVDIAEKLSKGFPHVRVDLYNIDGKIYFGELTFFHGSGLTNHFEPPKWDYKFGGWIRLPNE